MNKFILPYWNYPRSTFYRDKSPSYYPYNPERYLTDLILYLVSCRSHLPDLSSHILQLPLGGFSEQLIFI